MKINFLSRKKISKEQLVDEIRSKLTKNGYKWEMHEGELLLTKNDNIFRVCFWGNHNNTIFRTYFVWHYSNEWLKQFEPWMLDLETCMTNREYPHTTSMMLAEDLYCCRFETAVCNAEDFLYDFEVANCRISEAVGYFFDRLHKREKKILLMKLVRTRLFPLNRLTSILGRTLLRGLLKRLTTEMAKAITGCEYAILSDSTVSRRTSPKPSNVIRLPWRRTTIRPCSTLRLCTATLMVYPITTIWPLSYCIEWNPNRTITN